MLLEWSINTSVARSSLEKYSTPIYAQSFWGRLKTFRHVRGDVTAPEDGTQQNIPSRTYQELRSNDSAVHQVLSTNEHSCPRVGSFCATQATVKHLAVAQVKMHVRKGYIQQN